MEVQNRFMKSYGSPLSAEGSEFAEDTLLGLCITSHVAGMHEGHCAKRFTEFRPGGLLLANPVGVLRVLPGRF